VQPPPRMLGIPLKTLVALLKTLAALLTAAQILAETMRERRRPIRPRRAVMECIRIALPVLPARLAAAVVAVGGATGGERRSSRPVREQAGIWCPADRPAWHVRCRLRWRA
jgi:hypothetical protein